MCVYLIFIDTGTGTDGLKMAEKQQKSMDQLHMQQKRKCDAILN